VYDTKTFENSSLVEPEDLQDLKETVFVYHDKSTIHAKERPKSTWLLPGTSELRSKNTGRLIHISDFILETTGQLKLSDEEFLKAQQEDATKPTAADAATVIYPGSKGDSWWDMERLCDQVLHKAIPIFNILHPNSQAVFIFDCSSAHGTYAKTALRAQNMNLKHGGKQSHLRNSVIPFDNPHIPLHLRGMPQSFVYGSSHPDPLKEGKPKGIRAILEERGLWQHYSAKLRRERKPPLKLHCNDCAFTNIQKDAEEQAARLIQQAEDVGYFLPHKQSFAELEVSDPSFSGLAAATRTSPTLPQCNNRTKCCWSKIMSCQSDFKNERPLLQSIIEDAGHVCLFLPKFHCELNPIELFWSYIKDGEFLQPTNFPRQAT
jgi:hypothetical protein